jgi:glutamine synthetase
LIAAGSDGIERGLEPMTPIDVDPADLTENEKGAAGIARYPASLIEALDHLDADGVLRSALGELLADSYLAVRRSEYNAYADAGEEFQFAGHFAKY